MANKVVAPSHDSKYPYQSETWTPLRLYPEYGCQLGCSWTFSLFKYCAFSRACYNCLVWRFLIEIGKFLKIFFEQKLDDTLLKWTSWLCGPLTLEICWTHLHFRFFLQIGHFWDKIRYNFFSRAKFWNPPWHFLALLFP